MPVCLFVVLTNNWWRMSYDCLWSMCQSTIYVYMGAKFSSIYWIPWSHQSTSPSYLTFINTVNSLYEPAQPWNTLKIPQKSPPPSLNLNHSLVIDFTLENLTQVSPIVCLSVLYYMSTCAFICTCNTDKQYCCEAMFLRLWATKFSLLCLSVHLCACLSVFFNAAADCYHTIWLWAT